jgi:hypothetical protein
VVQTGTGVPPGLAEIIKSPADRNILARRRRRYRTGMDHEAPTTLADIVSIASPPASADTRRAGAAPGGGNREFREFATSRDVRGRESSGSCVTYPWPRDCSCQTLDIAMLRIERSADGEDVCFTITGRVEAVHLAELQRLIDEERAAHRPRTVQGDRRQAGQLPGIRPRMDWPRDG